MNHQKPSAMLRALTLLVGALFILNAATAATAQSGRRIPKRPPTADPTTPKESEPPITPPEEKKSDKPPVSITLAKHLNDIVYSSDIYLNAVMSGFLERVSKLNYIKVQPNGSDMNRKQAYDAAKASPDRYVVWFQLASDQMTSTPQSDYNYGYTLYVDFVVFTPGTGKTLTSGHIYQRQRGAGPVNLPIPQGTTAEYSLRYAGAELADRVLDKLDLATTTTTPPTH